MGDVNTVGKGTIDGARKQTPNTCRGEASVEEISSYHRAPKSQEWEEGAPWKAGTLLPRYFGERTFFRTNSGRGCCCLDVQITAEECGWAVLVIELLSLGFVMLGTGHHEAHLCFAASF